MNSFGLLLGTGVASRAPFFLGVFPPGVSLPSEVFLAALCLAAFPPSEGALSFQEPKACPSGLCFSYILELSLRFPSSFCWVLWLSGIRIRRASRGVLFSCSLPCFLSMPFPQISRFVEPWWEIGSRFLGFLPEVLIPPVLIFDEGFWISRDLFLPFLYPVFFFESPPFLFFVRLFRPPSSS